MSKNQMSLKVYLVIKDSSSLEVVSEIRDLVWAVGGPTHSGKAFKMTILVGSLMG